MTAPRLLIIGVLLCLITAISLRFMVFISYVHCQKSEFRSSLLAEKKSEIMEVRIPAAKLYVDGPGVEWKEDNKELVLANVYHEVISVKLESGYALISIIEDRTENSLFNQFFATETESDGLLKLLLQLLFSINFVPADLPLNFSNIYERLTHQRSQCSFPLLLAQEVLTPPPAYYL